ncbi:MAG: C25 family cysteine peptidase, partial [Candidatus Eisenbacteria bacterium]
MRDVIRPRHLRAVVLLTCVAAATCATSLLAGHAGATGVPVAPRPDVAHRSDRPSVEVVSQRDDGVTLRFEATERSSQGVRSVFVQVPDTGRIETELGDVPGMDASSLVEISEPAVMRDLRVVNVLFSPTPAGAGLEDYARALTVTLRATGEPGVNEKKETGRARSRAFHGLYQSTVINYDAEAAEELLNAQTRGGRDPLPFGATYLVISYFSYADEVAPLVEWKNAKGIQSKLVTLTETGSTEAEIRSYVQTAYDTWEVPPEYVLLVGDTEVLPGYDSLTYTDNYYTTVEGTDYLADILIGRISADSGTQVSTQVAKILGYEKTPLVGDPNWPMSASMWVHDDFDSGDWIYYMNTWRIYDQFELAGFSPIDTLFHRNGVSQSEIYSSVTEGKGFINFRGQAWINWLAPFNLNASYTNNGWRLPIVVSATCGTGNYESDGFVCENWMRAGSASNPEGSVAFFATNTAFPGSEELSLRRGYVDEGFFDSVFETDDGSLGAACVAGRMRLHLKDEDQIDYEGWNLLGDPEMQIWTAQPFELSALFDGGTQIGASDFAVTVLSGGSLHEGARVACTKADEVLTVGYSDVNGHVSLPIAPTTTGTMTVTVTDRNGVPFQGDVFVLDSGPFVVYSDVVVEDSPAGNADGHLNTGETSDLDVALSNIGDIEAPAVTARFRT